MIKDDIEKKHSEGKGWYYKETSNTEMRDDITIDIGLLKIKDDITNRHTEIKR